MYRLVQRRKVKAKVKFTVILFHVAANAAFVSVFLS